MLMVLDTKANICLIRKTASASTNGLMEESMKVGGTRGNSMVQVYIVTPQKEQQEKVFGSVESALSGSTTSRPPNWLKECLTIARTSLNLIAQMLSQSW